MKKEVVGIRFKKAGKKYYFDADGFSLSMNDYVVVETIQGLELGTVIEEVKTLENDPLLESLKPILRKANQDDIKAHEENINSVPNVLETTRELIQKNDLKMKLLNADYTLDRGKLLIEFTANGRVDFRDLVKDLAGAFKTRIELKQVGARDTAKHLGGIGPCGLILCCNTFLGEFDAISIKMAKNQNLALSPANISGLCGKLLCCLKYEDDMYTEMRIGLPKEQSKVWLDGKEGTVLSNNVLERRVRIYIENQGVTTVHVDDIKTIHDAY